MPKLKGKLGKAYEDNVLDDERIDVRLQPSAQGEAIVVTDKRVMIIKAGTITGAGLFGASVKSFSYNQITSVDLRIGILGGHMQLTVAGSIERQDRGFSDMFRAENAITFTANYKERMKAVAEIIRSKINQPTADLSDKGDLVRQLRELAELRSQGILNDEEFEAAKKKLL